MDNQSLETYRRQLAEVVASEKLRMDECLAKVEQIVDERLASLSRNAQLQDEASARQYIRRAGELYRDRVARIPPNWPEGARIPLLAALEKSWRQTVANILQTSTIEINKP